MKSWKNPLAEDCAHENRIPGRLFNKMSNEGVSSDSGRWIKLERAGLKKRKRERERERERKGDGTQAPRGRIRWPPWPATRSSLESSRWGATVHGFRFQKHSERGERCESVPNYKRGRGGGFRGGSRWRHERPVGARGENSRGHGFAWEKAGEGE
jgi:hypothetical protein